jgi:hypothetical protein
MNLSHLKLQESQILPFFLQHKFYHVRNSRNVTITFTNRNIRNNRIDNSFPIYFLILKHAIVLAKLNSVKKN